MIFSSSSGLIVIDGISFAARGGTHAASPATHYPCGKRKLICAVNRGVSFLRTVRRRGRGGREGGGRNVKWTEWDILNSSQPASWSWQLTCSGYIFTPPAQTRRQGSERRERPEKRNSRRRSAGRREAGEKVREERGSRRGVREEKQEKRASWREPRGQEREWRGWEARSGRNRARGEAR